MNVDRRASIAIGVVGAPFALEGALAVSGFSGETAHWRRLRRIELRTGAQVKRMTVASLISEGGRAIIKFVGVDDREAARALSGWELWAARRFALRLHRGQYYAADLCRCAVYHRKRYIGTIRSVWDSGAHDILEIECAEGTTTMVPFRKEVVRKPNIVRRRIELASDWMPI